MVQQTVNLQGTGFKLADDSVKHRLIASLASLEKQGKTHFALTAPGPLAVFDFDNGLEGVLNKFAKRKTIYVSEYKLGNSCDLNTYLANLDKFKREFLATMKPGNGIRSVLVDTATEMWELMRMARFGKLTQVLPHNYGPVNAEFRELIRVAYTSDKNLLLLHKMKPEYVNDKSTGKVLRAGFGEIGFLVQVNIELRRDAELDFTSTVKDCRQNEGIAGLELVGDMNNFPSLAQLVFPESNEEEWK